MQKEKGQKFLASMDFFLDQYQCDYIPGDIFLLDEEPIPVKKQSAFVNYVNKPIQELSFSRKMNGIKRDGQRNMNVRMIEFLRRNPVGAGGEDSERERGRRHMISERIRREKQKNCYSSLHTVLPHGTKNDKNSIVQVAAKEVEELRRWKEELNRQNSEMERRVDKRKLLGVEEEEEEEKGGPNSKIELKVAYPSSGIDSMLGVLKCLKETGSNPIYIHSQFSANEFSAVFHVENKRMEGAEVEKAVQRSLYEVEKKFRFQFSQG